MDKVVHWTLEFDAKDGRADDVRSLMKEMVDATRDTEPQTLGYEWTSTNDGATWQLYERYADSEATMVHMNNFFTNFGKKFLEVVNVKRLDIYGSPDETVRKTMGAMGPRYFEGEGGFSR